MLIAYNNDVQHNNRWYHIQTEDNGIKDGHITTTVFFSGQILDSKTTSYKEAIAGIVNEDQINAVIKDMMIKQHQAYYRRLDEGMYDGRMQASQQHPSPASSKLSVVSPSMATGAVAARMESGQKPDILRASQQAASIQRPAAMQPGSAMPRPESGVAYQPAAAAKPVAMRPAAAMPANQSAKNVMTSCVSQPIAVPRSKAVEAARLSVVHRAYKGVTWPNDDLAIDVLVVSMLEKI